MGYTSVEQRNKSGAGIKEQSVFGYVPVSSRLPEQSPAISPTPGTPPAPKNVGGYVPVEERGGGFQTNAPAPLNTPAVAPTKPVKQGFISRTSNAVGNAIDRPENKTQKPELPANFNSLPKEEKIRVNEEFQKANAEWAKKNNFWNQLPSAVMESLPFGLGAVFKTIHDEENFVINNPSEYETSGIKNVTAKDALEATPGAVVDTAKGFVKAPISGAVNIYDAATGKRTKFNIPGLGEVSTAQYRTAERVANGENPVVVALEEGSTAILDTLFFASLAAKPFQGRPTVTARAEVPADLYSKTPGASKAMQPKSFRLYEPKTTAQPLSPEFIQKAQSQGINFGPKFKPELPTYFKMSFQPKANVFRGEIVQIKPSYFKMLTNLFGKKADPGYRATVKNLESSGHDLDRAIEAGDMPMEKVYKNKQGQLTPEYAKHTISDLAGKLDEYHPGLGEKFKASVDLSNPTPTNLDLQAKTFLEKAVTPGSNLIPTVIPFPTPAQIQAVPPAQMEVVHSKEVKTTDIEKAAQEITQKTIENKGQNVETAPLAESKSQENITPKDVQIGNEIEVFDGQGRSRGAGKVLDVGENSITIQNKVNDIRTEIRHNGDLNIKRILSNKKPTATPAPERVRALEDELKNSYKNYPEAESEMAQILTELELAEAGKRIFLEHDGTRDSNVIGVPSTFPAWIPENLRTKKSLDALLEVIKSIETISYPSRSNAVAKRLLVNEMLSVLDSRLGIDTSGIRSDILKEYGQSKESDNKGAGGSEQPAGRGTATAERAKIEAKKKAEKDDRIAQLKREIEERDGFDGKLSDEQVAERKAELAKLEGGEKTQKEKVAESLKDKPKSIKEVSRETNIKEPNIRRILGVGAKEGVFERVDKGVYVLSKNGEDMAYVEAGDALESLPRLAGEGFKADMVFLDIPYDTPAVKGGNRGVDYKLLSVSDFGKILDATGKIVRDEKAPVIHMFSQAPSGMKAMEKYNDLFIQKGWKPVGRGQYQKTFADGSPVTSPNGKVAQPEGILVFTKSGEIKKDLKNLNFTLKRPKGYQTEKPAEMLKAMIEMTTEEGDIVLDPFAGSGVTGAEAVRAGRKAYLVEKDVEVAEKITKPRVKEALDEKPKMPKEQMDKIMERVRNKQGVSIETISSDEIFDVQYPKGPSGKGEADIETFRKDVPIELGNMDKIRPIEFPELVDLARDLMGKIPDIRKRMGNKLGMFSHSTAPGDFGISLKAEIFEDPDQAAKILAHEIGHLIDYLPDETMARGNLIGRLKTLRNFMGETFGTESTLLGQEEGKLSETRRQQIKNRITKDVLVSRGLKFGDMFGDKMTKAEKQSLNKEISEKTREAVNELLEKEGFIQNKVVKKELMEVSLFWRPAGIYETLTSSTTGKPEKVFTEMPLDQLPQSYQKYRKSSKELYADALSMLINTPGTLEKMAPTFYKEFFEALDKKPAVFNAYFELQELLGGDRDVLLERRRAGVKGMFERGDLKAADIQRTRMKIAEQRRKDFLFKFKFDFIDKNYALIDRVNKLKKEGKIVSDDENPVFFLEERNYLGGKIKAFMEKNIQPIYKKLTENDISWNDFGEALFYDRIVAGDRSDVANPRGITPKAAEELLAKIKKEMPEDRLKILEQSMDDFREAIKSVAEEAFQEGLYKPEMHDKMMENPAYVTFQVLDHLEEGMTSKIHKSIGTLKDISNPADSSLLKTIVTMRVIEQNKVKRAVVQFLEKSFPEDILPAKVLNTPKGPIPQESKLPNQELITYMKDGKRQGYYVDPYIKHSVENSTVGYNNAIVDALKMMNSGLFRPLFITYNPGFQAFNFLRDFQRFWKNTPTMTIARAIKLYRQAVPVAKARAWGIKDMNSWGAELLSKMEEEQILSISYNQLTDSADVEDRQIDAILQKSGIDSFQPEVRYKALQPFVKVLNFIKNMGDFIETLPKVAGYLEFTEGGKADISKEQKSFIRKNIGSPDFLAGGFWKPVTNEVFLFSNSITQGIRSDVGVAINPKTRSGYWWKTAKVNFLPKLIMYLATLGFFGAAIKEMMDNASEYDKTNYTIIPLGTDENGKAVYFRFPQDEGGRLLGGLLWKVFNSPSNKQGFGKDAIDLVTFTGGQLPSISPAATSVVATGQYISGQNPYDWFRNREVLTDDQMQAGGMYSLKPFLGWLFNQSGGGVFYYFQQGAPRDKSGTEKFFNLPLVGNIAGRFLKVSDYGKTEKFNQIKEEVQSDQAKRRIDENTIINDFIKDSQSSKDDATIDALVAKNRAALITEVLGHTPQNEDELTRAKNIEKKYKIGLQRGESDPYINALISANTNEEKGALIAEYKKTLSKAEFNKIMLASLKYKIVSQEAFINAIKSANDEQ